MPYQSNQSPTQPPRSHARRPPRRPGKPRLGQAELGARRAYPDATLRHRKRQSRPSLQHLLDLVRVLGFDLILVPRASSPPSTRWSRDHLHRTPAATPAKARPSARSTPASLGEQGHHEVLIPPNSPPSPSSARRPVGVITRLAGDRSSSPSSRTTSTTPPAPL